MTTNFYIYYIDAVGFLWLNFIGAGLAIIIRATIQNIKKPNHNNLLP